MKNLKNALQQGKTMDFQNEENTLSAECSFKNEGFRIFFNGAFIHISRTFDSFEKKLNQLIEDHDLEFKTNEFMIENENAQELKEALELFEIPEEFEIEEGITETIFSFEDTLSEESRSTIFGLIDNIQSKNQ